MAALIDAHAHLCSPAFAADLEAVLARARAHGIEAVITVGETLADAHRNLELAERFPAIKPAAGLSPEFCDLAEAEALAALIRAERQRLVAVGEVGLDFWLAKEEADRERQRRVFAIFIDLACELDLPLQVHARSAGRHAVGQLLDQNAQKVQLHAFDGKFGAAQPAVEAGYFFSIPPSVVRSVQKQRLVKNLPLSCLLIESDSPVLGPHPTERNEPANAVLVVDAIAEIKHLRREEVAEAVTLNTFRLYGPLSSS